ncbi:hypothetical protein BGW39_008022 [Mortierella sp. 14UC]|nr:hypothetical protein BGW39_008022 [Mortierella sp. 14UC]
MSESPLPLECLRIVLDNLAHEEDIHSLSTCLRVNRFFANATLPFLYKHPFQDSFHPTHIVKGIVNLARTLLRQAPPENVTDLLRAFYFGRQDFDDNGDRDLSSSLVLDSEPYVPVLHYLPHVKTLLPRTFPTRDLHSQDANSYFGSDRLDSYLKTSGLDDKYRNMVGVVYDESYQDYLYGLALRQDIERQLGWALCLPKTVQDLTISVTDCQQYLDNVEQFKTLAHIQFTFDNQFQFNRFTPDEPTPEDTAREQELHRERVGHLETMVALVQEHTRIHRKVLRTASCHETYVWEQSEHPVYDGYQLRLLKFLPPLYNPTVLDGDSMLQFCLNPEDTNLGFVERIYVDGSLGDNKVFLDVLSSSLHRCRALRHINLDLQGDDLFLWAVEERQEHDRQRNNGQSPTKALVPIESARFQYDVPRYGPQIESFIQAFGSSLHSFAVNGQFVDQTFHEPVEEPVVCGRQWSLPKLDQLTMITYLAPLVLDPNALSDCPALQHLYLEDSLNGTQVSTNTPSWNAVVLPRLSSLTLKGSPALAFHPDTLYNTPELDSLCFSMDHHAGFHVLPPVQELSYLRGEQLEATEIPAEFLTRPVWSWDWHLPVLRDVIMTAEFAFSFQFRMLRQTPLLQKIHLNSSTADGLHERTITLEELQDESGDGFLSLPQLVEFRLVGRWRVDGQVWKTLFHQVAPNIEDLEEGECFGFGLQDWIEATSALEKLDEAYSSLDVTDEQLVAQGLKLFEYSYDPVDDVPPPGAKFNFQGGTFRYVRPPPVDSASKEEAVEGKVDEGEKKGGFEQTIR